jgi:hypothetical protein
MFRRPRTKLRLDEARAWRAIVALRVEVIRTATNYGVMSAKEEDVPEWREWTRFLEEELVGRDGGSVPDAASHGVPDAGATSTLSAWFDQLRERLDDAERGVSVDEADAMPMSEKEFWVDSLERLAERARDIEELGSQPLGEEDGRESTAGVALLGALEDSLVLALSDTQANRAERLTAHELYDLIKAAQTEGVWRALSAL